MTEDVKAEIVIHIHDWPRGDQPALISWQWSGTDLPARGSGGMHDFLLRTAIDAMQELLDLDDPDGSDEGTTVGLIATDEDSQPPDR